jgi:multidrug efflux system membrane fusion protein
VELGPLVDGLRVVRNGISAEDWIILRGQQRVRPDQKIVPKRVPIEMSDALHGGTGSVKKP